MEKEIENYKLELIERNNLLENLQSSLTKNNDYKKKFEDLFRSFELLSNESEITKNKLSHENKLLSERLNILQLFI